MSNPKEKPNMWKRATIILAIMLAIGGCWTYYADWKVQTDYISPEGMCSRIRATPTWMDKNGDILGEGVQMFNTSLSKDYTDYFINDSVYLIYNSGCSACIKQIEIFGEEWERYKESGLAIDCSEVLK